ncbi:MAG: alginate export family protein [Planctomycetaceae bacterium]
MSVQRPYRVAAVAMLTASLIASASQSANAQNCFGRCQSCDSSCDDSGKCQLDLHELFNEVAGDESLFDAFKNREIGGIKYSVGGELRHRFMNEKNRLRPPGGNAEYSLWRFTPYLQMQFTDRFGGFVEGIDASAFTEGADPYSPVAIDVNRMDFLRYYGEYALINEKDQTLKYRYGRQYLSYGGQRLLSPLAWSNTFRNFEGHKLMYSGSDWNVDAFMMTSVNGAAGGSGFGPRSLDTADSDRTISGVYSTYKGMEASTVDLYWLYFDEANDVATIQDGSRHTVGSRLAGTQAIKECDKVVGTWAWDFEGAYQFGRDNGVDVSAGMAAASVGYTFNDVPWTPGFNAFYYWSSGGNPAGGTNHTFFTMYPLGHAYWGLIDNFSGQNLHDAGLTLSAKPHKKLALAATYHHFEKSDALDNVYNIVGAPIGVPNGSSDLGNEFDVVATIPVSQNFNVQAGYFWFFYGDALAGRNDATQFYLQTTLKF